MEVEGKFFSMFCSSVALHHAYVFGIVVNKNMLNMNWI